MEIFFLIDDLETFATSNDLLQRTSEFPELFGLFDFFLFYPLNNDVFWHKFISSVINVIFWLYKFFNIITLFTNLQKRFVDKIFSHIMPTFH